MNTLSFNNEKIGSIIGKSFEKPDNTAPESRDSISNSIQNQRNEKEGIEKEERNTVSFSNGTTMSMNTCMTNLISILEDPSNLDDRSKWIRDFGPQF